MTALTVPTLVVAGLFGPSVSVLPLTQQAMVPCPLHDGPFVPTRFAGTTDACVLCDGSSPVPFVSGPIHIAHQCPDCSQIAAKAGLRSWPVGRGWTGLPCGTCGGIDEADSRRRDGSGWVVRSAQAEQVLAPIMDGPNVVGEEYLLLVSGVSSETSPYLGDVTPGWRA